MPLNDQDIHDYQALISEIQGRALDAAEAKEELTRLLHLWWILGHPPPVDGVGPFHLPPPSWF